MSFDFYISAFHPKALNVVCDLAGLLAYSVVLLPSRLNDSGVKIKQHKRSLQLRG